MSKVFPFKAYRYQFSSDRLRKVVCPPYDVIGELSARNLRKNPANAIHIELPEGPPEKKYQSARKIWDRWKAQKIIGRDREPAFYVYEQIFTVESKKISRKGFFCELGVEQPGAGSVLRHELTLAKPKEDRLNLLKTLQVNSSPIFGLFSDKNKNVLRILNAISKTKPSSQFKDRDNVIHRLWICSDSKKNKLIQNTLLRSDVLIADGHHRYETAWNYFKENRGRNGSNKVFSFLCPMEDPGLVVFPTHRVLTGKRMNLKEIMSQLESMKDILKVRPTPFPLKKSLRSLRPPSFIATDGRKSWTITVRSLKISKKLFHKKPKSYLELSLIYIHFLLMPNLKKEDFFYTHLDNEAVQLAKKNRSIALLVPPTLPEDLYRVVKSGELMPQKSTYFYPKIITGLIFRSVT